MATFSEALEAFKKGKSARRTIWTDKGKIKLKFGHLIPAVEDAENEKQAEAIQRVIEANPEKPDLKGIDESLFIVDPVYPSFQFPHLANDIDEAKGVLYGWVPLMQDILASDWEIV